MATAHDATHIQHVLRSSICSSSRIYMRRFTLPPTISYIVAGFHHFKCIHTHTRAAHVYISAKIRSSSYPQTYTQHCETSPYVSPTFKCPQKRLSRTHSRANPCTYPNVAIIRPSNTSDFRSRLAGEHRDD